MTQPKTSPLDTARWVAVLPVAFFASLASLIPVRWIVGYIYAEEPAGMAAARSEQLIVAFVAAFVFSHIGARIAPARQKLVALILTGVFLLVSLGIRAAVANQYPDAWHILPILFNIGGGLFGGLILPQPKSEPDSLSAPEESALPPS